MKLKDLVPEKKLSYNEAYNKKRMEIQLKPDKYYKHSDHSGIDMGVRDKKKSGHYEKTFFR